jgi:hypothetical protein
VRKEFRQEVMVVKVVAKFIRKGIHFQQAEMGFLWSENTVSAFEVRIFSEEFSAPGLSCPLGDGPKD